MSSGANTSDRLAAVAIPLCVWGMISALVLHLVDVREVFIQGGEARLRQATLAFAAGVILIQRLSVMHGKSTALGYMWGLGASIGLFAGWHAASFPTAFHPVIVFAVTVALYSLLWWAAHRITAACSVDSPEAVERAASSGILTTAGAPVRKRTWRFNMHAPDTGKGTAVYEAKWTEKLPAPHPGSIILRFSLLALPVFAAGPLIFPADDSSRIQLGVWFFVFIWCALALLSLSSLRQLSVYFQDRGVTLPDIVGLTWMALGIAAITCALIVAWLLPQPQTDARFFVRERIVTSWRTWEANYGFRQQDPRGRPDKQNDPAGKPRPGETAQERVERELAKRHENIDKMNDPELSKYARQTGIEPEHENVQRLGAAITDNISKFFSMLIPGIIIAALGCALFVLLIVGLVMLRRGLEGVSLWGNKQSAHRAKQKQQRERAVAAAPAFSAFGDPFAPGAPQRDAASIVRHMWAATLAWCAQMGAPCPPERTALEFIEGNPEPLSGFEQRARFLADWLAFAEFSGQPVPETLRPELQDYWLALTRHVGQA